MATRRTGQNDKHLRKHKPSEQHVEYEANPGQKEARLDKEKESKLSSMGETSRDHESSTSPSLGAVFRGFYRGS